MRSNQAQCSIIIFHLIEKKILSYRFFLFFVTAASYEWIFKNNLLDGFINNAPSSITDIFENVCVIVSGLIALNRNPLSKGMHILNIEIYCQVKDMIHFETENILLNIYNCYKFILTLNQNQSYCKFQLLVLLCHLEE